MRRIVVANLTGLVLGSLLLFIPRSDSIENMKWIGPGGLIAAFMLLASLYFQYVAISSERTGRFKLKADISRETDPKSFAFAQIITCLASSLLFALLIFMLSTQFS